MNGRSDAAATRVCMQRVTVFVLGQIAPCEEIRYCKIVVIWGTGAGGLGAGAGGAGCCAGCEVLGAGGFGSGIKTLTGSGGVVVVVVVAVPGSDFPQPVVKIVAAKIKYIALDMPHPYLRYLHAKADGPSLGRYFLGGGPGPAMFSSFWTRCRKASITLLRALTSFSSSGLGIARRAVNLNTSS